MQDSNERQSLMNESALSEKEHRDKCDQASSLTSVTRPEDFEYSVQRAAESFADFVRTIARLRAPEGCPWDRAQTHKSIAHNMIEEAYEALETIETHQVSHLREELGDVLLQVMLHSQIAADDGEFTIEEVCTDINAKMIRRHPHVFGEACAHNAQEVLGLWDQIKLKEHDIQKDESAKTSLLDSVPRSLPALMQAQKISRKSASVGFEWDSYDEVYAQLMAELDELARATTQDEQEEELGDVLFTAVNLARFVQVDSEDALRRSCEKFRRRWAFVEDCAQRAGSAVSDATREELETWWQQAKCAERTDNQR